MTVPTKADTALLIFDFDRDDQSSCWDEANNVLGFSPESEDRIGTGKYCAFIRHEDEAEGLDAETIIRREIMTWPSSSARPVVMIFLDRPEDERTAMEAKLRGLYPLSIHVLAA